MKKIKSLVLSLLAVIALTFSTKAENLINTSKMEQAVKTAVLRGPSLVDVEFTEYYTQINWVGYLDTPFSVNTEMIVTAYYYTWLSGSLQHATLFFKFQAGVTNAYYSTLLPNNQDYITYFDHYVVNNTFPY